MNSKVPKWTFGLLILLSILILSLFIAIIFQNSTIKDAKLENMKLAQKQSELVFEKENYMMENKKKIERLLSEVENGLETITNLENELETLQSKSIFPNKEVIERLKSYGFDAPIDFYNTITSTLNPPPDLGSLGNGMQWYPSEFYLINEHWVLGYFEDGHSAGHALLKYTLFPKGEVEWEVIAAELY